MKKLFLRYPKKTERLIEILVPLSSWILISLPIWLSLWHPAVVAYLLIIFDVYWFVKSFRFAYHAIKSHLTMIAHTKVNWSVLIQGLPDVQKVHHVIIIPEYKEPLHILQRTLDAISKQDINKEKIIIVLATEEKDEYAKETSEKLKLQYDNLFLKFIVTSHKLQSGEVAGKSSNMAWAGSYIYDQLKHMNIDTNFTTVTSCDADAQLHPKYLSNLTFNFLTDADRDYHFFQGAILFYSNIWRLPLPNKFFNTLNSIYNLSMLSQSSRFINFSTYSLCIETAKQAGFWGVDVIPEDYHLFFKVYFTFGEKVQTKGIFLPVLVDAAESYSFIKTIINQYEQSKRWAWGIADIPYVIRSSVLDSKIPFLDKSRRVATLLEHHILWPANWFILAIGGYMPTIINPEFGRTVLGHNLAQISSGILTLSTVFLIVVFIIDWKTKPPRPKDYAVWKIPLLYLQWFTFPLISLVLSALPGLDAHTRLMLGKRLEYRVTEKV